MSFSIMGTGRAHPEFILTNDMLSTFLDTSDEWISTRTGIKSRFIATNETLCELAVQAGTRAMNQAGITPNELDLILCSTIQGDYQTPSLSCQVQYHIGANCPAFDLNAACSGFLYGLQTAAAFLDSGRASCILLISAEMMSRHLDWTDRSTCVLFGDGAGAVVLKKGQGLKAIRLNAKGDKKGLLQIGVAPGNCPYTTAHPAPETLAMAGGEVFKFAVSSMCRDIRAVVEQAGLTIEQINLVLPHQANMRIIHSAGERLGLREDQIISTIDHYGNTSSASIPLMLSELDEKGTLHRGDYLVLSAFGGGLTSGACVIQY